MVRSLKHSSLRDHTLLLLLLLLLLPPPLLLLLLIPPPPLLLLLLLLHYYYYYYHYYYYYYLYVPEFSYPFSCDTSSIYYPTFLTQSEDKFPPKSMVTTEEETGGKREE